MRIDRLLYFLRFARSRSLAAGIVASGHLRRNGERISRASQPMAPGDVLTIALGSQVRLVELLALPTRRGPPAEARACYRMLDPHGQTDLAAAQTLSPRGHADP
jgi:ribosome-associated heat shock protein Hsp15